MNRSPVDSWKDGSVIGAYLVAHLERAASIIQAEMAADHSCSGEGRIVRVSEMASLSKFVGSET